jgi:hypothetical protein
MPDCLPDASDAPVWSTASGDDPSRWIGQVISARGRLEANDGVECTKKLCEASHFGAPYGDRRLWPVERRRTSEPRRASDVCCNACGASIALVATGSPLFLTARMCAGADGLACCDLPADGREVVATGRLVSDGRGSVGWWWLEDVSVCQVTGGPEPQGAPAFCPAECGYALAASIALPAGLALGALGKAAATLCRNGECETLDLAPLVAEDARAGRACITTRSVGSRAGFEVRLGDCDPAGSLIVTYDPRPTDMLRDGDDYSVEVRSARHEPLARWQRRVHYAATDAEPDGGHCQEARFGELLCKTHAGRDLVCRCSCTPGDPLCACP